jgi:hypothetical protein
MFDFYGVENFRSMPLAHTRHMFMKTFDTSPSDVTSKWGIFFSIVFVSLRKIFKHFSILIYFSFQ